ncbi:enoyl-CoA delta isomerase 3, peroxisomal [Anthonomus grandis grandis]|uniref:enoyl-CoA delta isomerase 3, peroxisomal n=1 Tax=Anthonomus grandis grandis TaxID=2921223 RepID=UPI002165D668|nr:enoyl-CoA delta isomerase 3, peroxisomal [Anthonomus grandis grandis]
MDENHIKLSLKDGVRKIVINRPKKRNAFTQEMYRDLTNVLNQDATNDKIVCTILTGSGEFFSSGNDFLSAMQADQETVFEGPKNLIQAFIDYPKLLIAVINGPAIGVAATTAALCDIVYASDKAYFETPFVKLGLCPEGCSSYLYPQIFGRSKASEALLLGKRISAQEANQCGLISAVIPHKNLEEFITELYKYGSLPPKAVKMSKKLIMHHLKNVLNETTTLEIEGLKQHDPEEFSQAMMNFMQRKSKL